MTGHEPPEDRGSTSTRPSCMMLRRASSMAVCPCGSMNRSPRVTGFRPIQKGNLPWKLASRFDTANTFNNSDFPLPVIPHRYVWVFLADQGNKRSSWRTASLICCRFDRSFHHGDQSEYCLMSGPIFDAVDMETKQEIRERMDDRNRRLKPIEHSKHAKFKNYFNVSNREIRLTPPSPRTEGMKFLRFCLPKNPSFRYISQNYSGRWGVPRTSRGTSRTSVNLKYVIKLGAYLLKIEDVFLITHQRHSYL